DDRARQAHLSLPRCFLSEPGYGNRKRKPAPNAMSQPGVDEEAPAALLDGPNGPRFAELEKAAPGVERRGQHLRPDVDLKKSPVVWSGLSPGFRTVQDEADHDQDTHGFLHQVLRRCRLVASTIIVRS